MYLLGGFWLRWGCRYYSCFFFFLNVYCIFSDFDCDCTIQLVYCFMLVGSVGSMW